MIRFEKSASLLTMARSWRRACSHKSVSVGLSPSDLAWMTGNAGVNWISDGRLLSKRKPFILRLQPSSRYPSDPSHRQDRPGRLRASTQGIPPARLPQSLPPPETQGPFSLQCECPARRDARCKCLDGSQSALTSTILLHETRCSPTMNKSRSLRAKSAISTNYQPNQNSIS